MLKRDFNFDLNIDGGFGQTRDDPVVVLDTNPTDASMTQMQVLKGLGMGRGILWRILGRNSLDVGQANIEQIEIETIELTESEIITQQESYYFDVRLANAQGKPLPDVIVFTDKNTNINFSYEIGWLHFSGFRNYGLEVAGLGESIFYNAQGIKATIYIYDNLRKDIPDNIDSFDLRHEFESAVSDLITAHPSADSMGKFYKGKHIILQAFKVDGSFSLIGLGALGGMFIKLRITHDHDPVMIEISNQFIDAFESMIKDTILFH